MITTVAALPLLNEEGDRMVTSLCPHPELLAQAVPMSTSVPAEDRYFADGPLVMTRLESQLLLTGSVRGRRYLVWRAKSQRGQGWLCSTSPPANWQPRNLHAQVERP